jgi:hypothetical protein
MRLESVRELKQSLSASVVATLAESETLRSAGMAARSLEDPGTPRTVALGVAPKDARRDFALAVRLQKRGLEASAQVETIRKEARGEVDVRYIGRIVKRAAPPWHQTRQRPLLIGNSIGHVNITAGTLGCFVKARSGGAVHFLSNNHVLANENRGRRDDAIVQPGRLDDGASPEDAVGSLATFIRLKRVGANVCDAALGRPAEGVAWDATTLQGLGALAGVGDLVVSEGADVAKIGRTTGLTRGRVTAFEMDNVVVGFAMGQLRFDGQIEIEDADTEPFCRGGDSGSLIVDGERRAVALLFAGGDLGGSNGKGLTYANPFQAVCDALKVDLLY